MMEDSQVHWFHQVAFRVIQKLQNNANANAKLIQTHSFPSECTINCAKRSFGLPTFISSGWIDGKGPSKEIAAPTDLRAYAVDTLVGGFWNW